MPQRNPLPSHLVTAILSHLLPPTPPLPPEFIARDLLERLKYLPPGPQDIDAWLSPIPSPSPTTVADLLERLAVGYTVGPTMYASDGESLLAKVPLTSLSQGMDLVDTEGVNVFFSHEDGEKGRGWVYHSSQPASKTDGLEWHSDSDLPVTPPDVDVGQDHVSVADYWKDFSPPTTHSELPSQSEEDTEDAYWASYGATASGSVTPGAGLLSRRMSHEHLGRQTPGGHGPPKEARVLCDVPKPVNANGNSALDPLAALLSSLPDRLKVDEDDEDKLAAPPHELVDYRDKIRGRILGSLRDTWAEYIRNVEANNEALEEKAHGWLRIGQSVVGGSPDSGIYADTSEIIARAKLQVLKDLYASATGEQDAEVFWRHIESAIKMPMHPSLSAEAMGMTQETYWE